MKSVKLLAIKSEKRLLITTGEVTQVSSKEVNPGNGFIK